MTALTAHVVSDVIKTSSGGRKSYKATCYTCDYWTGYNNTRRRTERQIEDHRKAYEPEEDNDIAQELDRLQADIDAKIAAGGEFILSIRVHSIHCPHMRHALNVRHFPPFDGSESGKELRHSILNQGYPEPYPILTRAEIADHAEAMKACAHCAPTYQTGTP